MGAPFRYDQEARGFTAQLYSEPLQECRRARAQIHGHIPNRAMEAGNQFHFRMGLMLKMYASHRADLASTTVIGLDDMPAAQHLRQFVGAENPHEGAARIAAPLQVNDQHPGQGCRLYFHGQLQPTPCSWAAATYSANCLRLITSVRSIQDRYHKAVADNARLKSHTGIQLSRPRAMVLSR